MRSVLTILVLWHSLHLASLSAVPDLPASLADYRAYLQASELLAQSNAAEAVNALAPVWKFRPESPIAGRAAILAARAYVLLGKAGDAVTTLGRYSARLPQPEGDMLLGQALETTGRLPLSVAAYQRVYYRQPLSPAAGDAGSALVRLEAILGPEFPPAMPADVLTRATALLRAGRTADAKKEYLAAAARTAGVDREFASVRAHTGDYDALRRLTILNQEASAERFYLMHTAARRDGMTAAAQAALATLNEDHRNSPWRMEALISWGNHFLLKNQTAIFTPLFRTCFQDFSKSPQSAYCHWKVAWSAWIRRAPEAAKLFREHLRAYPDSDKAAAAAYFLGEHRTVLDRFPMSFYATLSRRKIAGRTTPPELAQGFTPNDAVRYRVERGRLLAANRLEDLAEIELRASVREQPFLIAMELASVAYQAGAYPRTIGYIAGLAPGYLQLKLGNAPDRFWRLAFPLPYKQEVESASRAQGLDPYWVAALIRQESLWDTNVISRANAYGLTQVVPSTGRELNQRLKLGPWSTEMLFNPAINLRLGTTYLRNLLDAHNGSEAQTLASYNAGRSRTQQWLTWYRYREPAEFIETIPFSETRNYVLTVLRNADVYRRVYSAEETDVVRVSN